MLKRVVVCILLFLFSLTGCADGESKMNKITFSQEFLASIEYSQGEWSHELRRDGVYEEVSSLDDGSVVLTINGDQQEYWQKNCQIELRKFKTKMSSKNKNYSFTYSDDPKEINLSYNSELEEEYAKEIMLDAMLYSSLYHLISGVDEESLDIQINIYNCDTGKLVKSGTNKEGIIQPTKEEWQESSVVEEKKEE